MALQIPAEMLQCPQWGAWKLTTINDRLTKVPYQVRTQRPASSMDATHWTDSAYALACVAHFQPLQQLDGLAYALGLASGHGGIDLDNVFGSGGELLNPSALELVKRFDSYTEYSPSGRGLHIIVRARIDAGKRHAGLGLEVYGTGRYFTVTGNVYLDRPIRDCQLEIDTLIAEIDTQRAHNAPADLDFSIKDSMSDEALYNLASTAANGQKFLDLWNGQYQNYNYPSASEADFALLDQIAFWTDSPNQVHRMFGYSALGKREKNIKRQDLVFRMIARSFDRKLPRVDVPMTTGLPQAVIVAAPPQDGPVDTHIENVNMEDEEAAWFRSDVFTRPYGTLGDIVDYCMASAAYPQIEVAIATAFTMLAGICGRQFQSDGTGLNIYLMLLGLTGTGKETMQNASSELINAVTNPAVNLSSIQPGQGAPIGYPSAHSFLGPAGLTGKGLLRVFAKGGVAEESMSCFCVLSEFENTLRQFSNIGHGNVNSGVTDFKNMLLQLYTKSKEGATYGGNLTAEKNNDVGRLSAPAFSFMCEATPSGVYGVLSEQMIKDGLLPRFIIIEVPLRSRVTGWNADHAKARISQQLASDLTDLCRMVHMAKAEHDQRFQVQETPIGAQRLIEYHKFVDGKADDAGDNDIHRGLWTRAFLTTRKLAALYAISINRHAPYIDAYMVDYAANIVTRQIVIIIGKFKRGEIGRVENVEGEQFDDVRKFLNKWMDYTVNNPFPRSFADRKEYVDARKTGFVPYSYLLTRATSTKSFKNDKRGIKIALKETLDSLSKTGTLKQMSLNGLEGVFYKVTL